MSVTAVAAAGTAVALWLYNRRKTELEWEERDATHKGAHQAPQTFMEDLYYFAEGLRYTYSETLGRWGTADLVFGLTYLCRKDPVEHVTTDISRVGTRFGTGMDLVQATAAARDLAEIRRVFQYCVGMRERRADPQRAYFSQVLGIGADAILLQEVRAGVLKPSFILARDDELRTIVLIIRGTHSFKDMFTSLTGASKPHHMVDGNGVVLGYSHFGMLAAARWVLAATAAPMAAALESWPGYAPRVVGHSLGGGTAALLTMMLRERRGVFEETRCVAVACPACMTLELARGCAGYVTSVVNGADVVPTVSPGAADRLRREVTASAWGGELRADLRATGLVRALETGVRGVGGAAATAGAWTGRGLAAACAPPRRYIQRRMSGRGGVGAGNAAGGGEGAPASALATPPPGIKRRMSDGALDAGAGLPDPRCATRSSPLLGRLSALGSAAGQRAVALSSSLPSGTALGAWWSATRRDAAVAAACFPDGGGRGEGAGGAARQRHAEDEDGVGDEGPLVSPRRLFMDADGGGGTAGPPREPASWDESPAPRHARHSSSASLEEEAAARMSEVEAAVQAAEEDEWAGGEGASPAIPSVFPPGTYGGKGEGRRAAAGSSSGEALAWRRALFPAGRILHLVPARLVPLQDAGFELLFADEGQGREGSASPARGPPLEPMSSSTSSSSSSSMSSLAAGMETDSPGEAASAAQQGPGGGESGAPAAAAAAAAVVATPGPLKTSGPVRPREPMVLLDNVPHAAYGRIRLCRDVLSDHIIPNYLASLDSALERLPPIFDQVASMEGGPGADAAACTAQPAATLAADVLE